MMLKDNYEKVNAEGKTKIVSLIEKIENLRWVSIKTYSNKQIIHETRIEVSKKKFF